MWYVKFIQSELIIVCFSTVRILYYMKSHFSYKAVHIVVGDKCRGIHSSSFFLPHIPRVLKL